MKSKKRKQTRALLGIDHGTENIGIALGKNNLVMPLKVISGRNEGVAAHEITRLALENKVSKIILGLPLNAEGRETKQALKVRRFANLLKVISKKPIDFYNEFKSTEEAERENHEDKIIKKGEPTDHLSAALILKQYQESLSSD